MNADTDTQKTETIADILREMRDRAITKIGGRTITERNFVPQETCESWADRIDAALAREAELADDDQFASHYRESESRKSESPTSLAPTGNAAAMREALEAMNCINTGGLKRLLVELVEADIFDGGHINRTISAVERARRALSAPARNCDRFLTVDEAYDKFMGGADSVVGDHWRFAEWLFAKAKGGDNE
jgi:hypothetical protein